MIYNFKFSEFIYNFQDINQDSPCKLVLISLPNRGLLSYKGNVIVASQLPVQIESCDVKDLAYSVQPIDYGLDLFTYKIVDSNNNNPKLSNMATFRINTSARANQPPSNVGDQNITIAYNTVETLTAAMFTTATTAPYADPENDPAYKVKILTLPNAGVLRFNSVNVTAGQEILISQISQGLLSYHSDSAQTTGYTTLFTFAVSDTGSQQFTS